MENSEEYKRIDIFTVDKTGKEQKISIETDKELYSSFGPLLQAERAKRNLSQARLGKMCGFYGAAYISAIELGKTNPTEKIMAKIAGVLGYNMVFSFAKKEEQK